MGFINQLLTGGGPSCSQIPMVLSYGPSIQNTWRPNDFAEVLPMPQREKSGWAF